MKGTEKPKERCPYSEYPYICSFYRGVSGINHQPLNPDFRRAVCQSTLYTLCPYQRAREAFGKFLEPDEPHVCGTRHRVTI